MRDMEVGDVPGNAGACAGDNRWTLAGAERDHCDHRAVLMLHLAVGAVLIPALQRTAPSRTGRPA